ncbi:hypothetical protein EXIGLDRAFT_611870 [Exidia glandulosa HHB12029]|uniref:Uncharacterized protein n=1 Tax=Exidia glandulosa HHB12029 TaxID=1314781 RepID=A0A166AQU9_EXIGL|nr:hypothetical protein EXIGLDRAFT_611870 [Exidia glandulosa HHB12029]
MRWDGANYSCAYDALFTAIFQMWIDNPYPSSWFLRASTTYTSGLCDGFVSFGTGGATLEAVRDAIRRDLHIAFPRRFVYGQTGCSVEDLADVVLNTDRLTWIINVRCKSCESISAPLSYPVRVLTLPFADTVEQCLKRWLLRKIKPPTCCNGVQYNYDDVTILTGPHMACFGVADPRKGCVVATSISAADAPWRISSVIYHGGFHFVMRHIDRRHQVWFNDGMNNNARSSFEGTIMHLPPDFLIDRTSDAGVTQKMTLIMYART